MIRTIRSFRHGFPIALLSLAALLAVLQPLPPTASADRVPITDYYGHFFPFYLDGKTYLFGLTASKDGFGNPKAIGNAANWWLINDDPGTGLAPAVKRAKMSSEYHALVPFYIDRHPYIFGLHKGENPEPWGKGSLGANIWRINNDGKGYELKLYKAKMSENHGHVISFQLRGEPYILGVHPVGVNIWRVKEGPKGLQFDLWKYKAAKIGGYRHFEVFYLNGHPHIFGSHDVGANIWRINDDAKGLELLTYGAKFHKDYDFVSTFHAGGNPYVFAATMDKEKIPMSLLDLGVSIAESLVKWEQLIYQPGKGYGVIWEIVRDPKGKLTVRKVTPKGIPISHRYKNMITFEQGGKAYIFGVHEENYGNIWRVNDDPASGFSLVYYGKTGKSIQQIVSESKTETR